MSQSRYNTRQAKKEEALNYHSKGRPGKSEVIPTKSCATARDLSNAYSPGVAWPCREIAEFPDDAFKYTNKGNLVGVISNGSAVLGLGNIGALAGKPVMEGKGVLFKKFADIDVFDIEINESTVEGMINVIKSMEPTFGGINLEDIKAPECFEVEKALKEIMNIPVFHDDQHGTAIITSAAFINALEVANKKIEDVKIVFSGAGAASIACANLLISLGVKKENLMMCDSKGVIYKDRAQGMNKYKEQFALKTTKRNLADAVNEADAFIGCSMKGILSKEMVATMAKNPIIFAMANPDPEILPEDVAAVRDDAIMATGRSDYPNQVNNVLGFPFIFRGALDVHATNINEEMKKAAVFALAKLAKEPVSNEVKMAYAGESFKFGKNYLIPKPFDKRVLTRVSPAIAQAAMDSGVARKPISDIKRYALELDERLGNASGLLNSIRGQLPSNKRSKIVFSEGTHPKILEAVSILKDEGVVHPIVIGRPESVKKKIKELAFDNLEDLEIIHPIKDKRFDEYLNTYFKSRQRKGLTKEYARDNMERRSYFASMMVKQGDADGMITGLEKPYSEAFKPIARILGKPKQSKASGTVILTFRDRTIFCADCTLQVNPSSEDLVDIAKNTYQLYKTLIDKEPRIAFLSHSSFGSSRTSESKKVQEAVKMIKEELPEVIIDGDMQADVAVNYQLMQNLFDFSSMDAAADILIFPDLSSANISYKLLQQLGNATAIGPIIGPMDYAANILQRTASVEEIVSITHLTTLISQNKKEQK